MAKKKKAKEDTSLSPELLELIRVTPEQTEQALARRKYTVHEPPEGVKAPRGKLFCYICGDWRKFSKSKKSPEMFDYMRCSDCNISIEDWYVRKQNGLFKIDNGKKKG